MKLTESERFPLDEEKIKNRDREELYQYFKMLIKKLNGIYGQIANVVNYNEKLRYLAQNAKPTPIKGELLVWKDTDATVGQSTHYLLYNDNGTVISWDSVEKA